MSAWDRFKNKMRTWSKRRKIMEILRCCWEATPLSLWLKSTENTPLSIWLTDTQAMPPSLCVTRQKAMPWMRMTDWHTGHIYLTVTIRHGGHTFFTASDAHRPFLLHWADQYSKVAALILSPRIKLQFTVDSLDLHLQNLHLQVHQ